jgi:hypothetical protein
MSKTRLVVKQDLTWQLPDLIKKLKGDRVLVGIPAFSSARQEDTEIDNATILAINEFGSPANNIPARPVMAIGIKRAQDQIANQLKLAAKKILELGFQAVDSFYERAGIIASSSIKRTIDQQIGIPPPAPSTIKARQRRGFKGTKALVVTGQMRNSIRWVIRRGGG